MTPEEAKEECERWLAYLDRQADKKALLTRLAADARAGRITPDEARREMRVIDSSPSVYDGARLADAVRVLFDYCGLAGRE